MSRALAKAAVTCLAAGFLVRSELHRRREREWTGTALAAALRRLGPGEEPVSVTVTARRPDGRLAAYTARRDGKGVTVTVRRAQRG